MNQGDSNPQGNSSNPTTPRRPLAIWVISVWYFMSSFFSISLIAAVQSRIASQTAAALNPLPRLETGDLLLAALLIALNLSAAGFLFLLKRPAVLFFKSALALNVGSNVWYLFHRGPGEQPLLMYAGVVMGWLVAAAVCRYAAELERKGILK